MRRQLVEMKRAQLESVTHEITGREGGRRKRNRGKEEKEEQRGRERGESSICILILCSLHTQNVLTCATS